MRERRGRRIAADAGGAAARLAAAAGPAVPAWVAVAAGLAFAVAAGGALPAPPGAGDAVLAAVQGGAALVVGRVEDAPRALDRLAAFRPHVALIDLGLPGLDGYALARLIRERDGARHVYLIALTGYGQADDQRRAHAAGFDVHLTKPVDPARLQALLAGR